MFFCARKLIMFFFLCPFFLFNNSNANLSFAIEFWLSAFDLFACLFMSCLSYSVLFLYSMNVFAIQEG